VDAAAAAFGAALGGGPLVRTQALYGLAQTAALRGDRSGAVARLREVVEAGADPSEPRRQLAGLLAAQGRPREALEELRKNLRGPAPQQPDADLAVSIARQAGDPSLQAEVERELGAGRRAR
jgi:Flp pilus assembly protein TadD